jgi:class 3 adenylate cyclase
MDPEDLRDVISAYQKCVADTVRRFDGFVAIYMGDGVLVYFGYPQAHEDDADRAVRAGLELIGALAALGVRVSLRTRVGIATGLVVVGDLIGQGAAQEQAVVGETPNLAARLQSLATPNSIVIGPTTRRILGDLFEYQDLGRIDVKGFDIPVQAYQVLRPSSVESRFEALRTTTTPLGGREEEIELLMRRWQQAQQGHGSVVLVCGEPGIGKSRIVQTVQDRLGSEPHIRLRYFCSPHHQDRGRWSAPLIDFALDLSPNESFYGELVHVGRKSQVHSVPLRQAGRLCGGYERSTQSVRAHASRANPQTRSSVFA